MDHVPVDGIRSVRPCTYELPCQVGLHKKKKGGGETESIRQRQVYR